VLRPLCKGISPVFHNHLARTAFVQPGLVICAESQKRRMNFQKPEYVLNESWWVTVMGCVMSSIMFALALMAV